MRKLSMRLLLMVLMVLPMFCNKVNAQTLDSKYDSVTVYNGITLGTRVLHREISDTNDTFTYGTGDTDKMSLAGYKYAIVEVVLGGTTPQWDVTPEFGDSTAEDYCKGQKRTVTQNERFLVEVDGETEFIVRCDGKSGTTPTIDVYVTPLN